MKISFSYFAKPAAIVILLALAIIADFAIANNQENFAIANNQEKIKFWDKQQKGANVFSSVIELEDVKAAKKYGIKFVRLAPDKFISAHRDFLIGNADDYKTLVKKDLARLKHVLDMYHQEGIAVVITMLSIPGSRWKQNNNNQDDLKIWRQENYQLQAELFWQDLAYELKDHPAIVGYNILNEPHLERIFAPTADDLAQVNQEEVQEILFNFYNRMIKSIRLKDKHTPIILDTSAHADANTFKLLKPQQDNGVIYSFHMYEPYEYTNLRTNQGKFSYPGKIKSKLWNYDALKDYMSEVMAFQKTYNIPSNRILVGEFGGHRKAPGLDKYFQDLIDIFTQEKWHFAFYAFREDGFIGMDYELGSKKMPASYWDAIESGQKVNLKRSANYPAFKVILESLSEK